LTSFTAVSQRDRNVQHTFVFFYPSLRFHKERVVRLRGLLMFSVNLLVLYLTSLYPQQEWLVMCTAFRLFKLVMCTAFRFFKLVMGTAFRLFKLVMCTALGLFKLVICTAFRSFKLVICTAFRLFKLVMCTAFRSFKWVMCTEFRLFKLVMCTAFRLFKFTRNEDLCFVKSLHHFIFTSNYKV
jgi:hypothetical protein